MIKLSKVNKYFNYHKSNENHVIKDITLELPDSGFVAIIGASGSGKTTLLNVICGLDKVNSGSITVENETINNYSSHRWDSIRNRYFGYIFQNYNIFEDRTVHQNVALALELLGITDKELIDERVRESLSIVHLEKYLRRKANSLSGGEQQRVAIARALVKDPKIIIADEPTGNLDEKNTINIMNILKQVSKTRLVVLVTHERYLADFYADRIIEIKDGLVSKDYQNSSTEVLVQHERDDIYLQDLEQEVITSGNIKISKYIDRPDETSLDLQIVINDGKIFIKAESSNAVLKVLSNNSEIRLIDSHRPSITRENINVEDYKISNLEVKPKRMRIPFHLHLRDGFMRIGALKGFKKLFLVSFILPSIMLVLGFSMWQGVKTVRDEDYLSTDKHAVNYEVEYSSDIEAKYQEYLEFSQQGGFVGTLMSPNTYLRISAEPFFLNNNLPDDGISACVIPSSYVSGFDKEIKQGEIVLDSFVVDSILRGSMGNGYRTKITTMSHLMNQTITIIGTSNELKLKIVGVYDGGQCSVYLNPADYQYVSFGLPIGFSVTTTTSDIPNCPRNLDSLERNEIIVPNTYAVGIQDLKFNGIEYTIVGRYNASGMSNPYIGFSPDGYQYASFAASISNNAVTFYSSNPAGMIADFPDIRLTHLAQEQMNLIIEEKATAFAIIFGVAAALMVVPLLFLYFVQRTNLLVKQKQIGILRALGMNKSGIYLGSVGEIIAMTILGTIPGYLFGVYFVNAVSVGEGRAIFSVNSVVVFGSLIVLLGINLLVGLIPTLRLLTRTPREILILTDM